MVTITLTNNNFDSKDDKVTINLNTGACFFSDNREMPLHQFIKHVDFVHPLLSEPFLSSSDDVYHYEYNNIRELFYSAIFVYKTLLHVDNPKLCVFKINPSLNFHHNKLPERLYFSIDGNKSATELISINQLNRIVSALLRDPYEYSEDLIINDSFTVEDLPESVNGDLFYPSEEPFFQIFENPVDLSRFELRYINPIIGFGVFSKTLIKNEEVLGIYSGVKQVNPPESFNFAYKPDGDSLNMILNARGFGNITRFINHAPNLDNNSLSADSSQRLFANSKGSIYFINGLSFIVYLATRDILPGEQLLVDYGTLYFKEYSPIRFKTNGRPLKIKSFKKMSKRRLAHLRIMANYGVQKAQRYLQFRMFLIISIICVLMASLHLLSF
ncbi:SET domain-containing protein-lysine N-methyltransferase [Legionella bononiensis]|uniref:SET domain-containing protein-lysine N-methyltransferase n=1 Tax=Legionella bononiensis TaxID=2793102 RepID=A0ABS1W7L4_9GAMM|nr:SET domain-containing protein-lysine N-methyltransferase [Legionella bononiensis]MBL7480161.1 SET domain-containing protein-lysine N-methyltransferase [Legionella bononiensis]MBL7525324.1 SET domain-containing protein-lysine N-methyltransferase [Legionella bononiensis]MBL7561508.1 SET domain-containing protein-lysine N-methyltransferase [Legionella bononiensis]